MGGSEIHAGEECVKQTSDAAVAGGLAGASVHVACLRSVVYEPVCATQSIPGAAFGATKAAWTAKPEVGQYTWPLLLNTGKLIVTHAGTIAGVTGVYQAAKCATASVSIARMSFFRFQPQSMPENSLLPFIPL